MGPRELVRIEGFRTDPDARNRAVAGVRGKAIDLSDAAFRGTRAQGARAAFSGRGNVPLRAGALSFHVAPRRTPWAVTVRTQSNDHPLPMPLWEVSGKGDLLELVARSRDYAMDRARVRSPNTGRGGWHHVVVSWSAGSPVSLVVDGREQLRSKRAFWPGWLSVGSIELQGAAFDDLAVLDGVPGAETIASLARQGPGTLPRTCAPLPLEPELRLQRLGWADDDAAIPVAGPTRIRRVHLDRALAMRRSGWRAVDGRHDSAWPLRYKGYRYLQGGALHLHPDPLERIDWLRLVGRVGPVVVAPGDAPQRPPAGPVVATLKGDGFFRDLPLAKSIEGKPLSVYRQSRGPAGGESPAALQEMALLRIDPGAPSRHGEVARGFLGSGSAGSLAGIHRARLLHWSPRGEREVWWFDRPAPGDANRKLEALRDHHFALPPHGDDRPLGAVRIHLDVDGWRAGDRVRIRVDDPSNPWRSLSDLDVRLERTGPLDVTLEFPATLLPAGVELLVTVTGERSGRLGGRSFLALHGPSLEQATASYLDQQLRLLSDAFAVQSEPRPWIFEDVRKEPLRIGNPSFDAIAHLVDDLGRRFPDDLRVRGYRAWLEPRSAAYWRSLPSPPLDRPRADGIPRWASLQSSILDFHLRFADWWIGERQVPNGEFGNGLNDDTDLVSDWTSLALIHDPDDRLRRSLRQVADFAWQTHIRNGLNVEMTDVLHAYEEGINVQPLAALLDYGNPVLVERLLATARRYDGFLLTEPREGKRRFQGAWFDTETVRKGSKWNKSVHELLILHPGLMLIWYDRHPAMIELAKEVWAGSRYPERPEPGLPHALYAATGDRRYVARGRQRDGRALWSRMLDEPRLDPASEKRLRALRFPTSGLEVLQNMDVRTLAKYRLWDHTRDESDLVPGLEHDWKQAWYAFGMRTRVEQSGDRVAVNKNLTDFMYLGGLPGARGHTFPVFAVSYEGFPRNFAALVLDDTPTSLRWAGYALGDAITGAELRVWNLDPGRYRVRRGPDRDADGEIDTVTDERNLDLVRGDAVPVSLEAGVRTLVELDRLEAAPPLWSRPDLAVTAEDATLEGRTATAIVHNLGVVPSGPFEVELVGPSGARIGLKRQPGLEGIADLRPRTTTVRFDGVPAAGSIRVRVRGEKPEITLRNNEATLR
jgi:hypothetical protein